MKYLKWLTLLFLLTSAQTWAQYNERPDPNGSGRFSWFGRPLTHAGARQLYKLEARASE